MDKDESANVLSTLESLGRLEGAMAGYYLACSESWGEASPLWMHLALEEEKHEKIIGDMARIIRKYPDHFRTGRRIEITAIDSFITWIEEKTDDVLKGKITLEKALAFALSMEGSILEGRFFELLISENKHYLGFMDVLGAELEKHRRRISEEIGKGDKRVLSPD